MVIVESQKEINDFMDYWGTKPSIVIPIWADLERHPMNTYLSFIYVRFDVGDYLIPFDHNDCQNIQIDLSQSTQSKWVWNKKGILQTELGLQETYDIQSQSFFIHNNLIDLNTHIEPITNFYTRLGLRDNLGKSLPIMKWCEVLTTLMNKWSFLPLNEKIGKSEWVDDTMIPILSDMERKGLHVDYKKFIDRWPANGKHLNGDIIWTEYNPYTLTSRPSNRHGGINFGALNKKDGSREVFIPRDGTMFLQFDYDAYHVRIIGKLIGYELPTTSVHQWLADQYGCPYDESKGRTFRILYGGVSDEDKEIPFFKEVDEFIQRVYTESQQRGYILTPKGRKIPLNWIEGENPQKVFNYLLQATETEFNMEVLKKLKGNGMELPILYTYDSFLFEYHLSWDTERAKEIKSVLESFGFPIKASWGMDYSKI
jgi:hypothetical protein